MASTAMTNSLSLIPFDGTNYQLWKVKTLSYFKGQGWYNAIFGDATKTVKTDQEQKSTGDTTELYKARAYAFLVNSLTNDVLSLFTNVAEDPAELWQALQKHYESNTVTSKHMVRQLMLNQKLSSGENISKYISRIVQYSQQLKGMGDTVSDSDMLFALFNGLTKDYDGLASSLNIQQNLKFEVAVQHLKDKYELLKLKDNAHDNNDTGNMANMVTQGNQGNNSKFRKYNGSGNGNGNNRNNNSGNNSGNTGNIGRRGICRTCNKPGHAAYYCPVNEGKRKCTYCHLIGHTKDECNYLVGTETDTQEQYSGLAIKGTQESKQSNIHDDDDYPEYCA